MSRSTADVPPCLDAILGFHIRMAHGAVYRHFNETFGAIELTQKQTSVLWLVGEHPGVSQTDIARLIQIDKATMMALTNSLADRHLLERRASTTDRRRQTLHLTPTGMAALTEAQAAVAAHEVWLKSRFAPEEVAQLIELLRRIHL